MIRAILHGLILAPLFYLQVTINGVPNQAATSTTVNGVANQAVSTNTINGVANQSISIGPTCTLPTLTSDWLVANSSNRCGVSGASSCTTSGQTMYSIADSISSNTASSGVGPSYELAQINSLPAALYGSNQYLTLGTAIPSSTTSYSFFAVVDRTSNSTNTAIVLNGPSSGGLEWRINTSQHQDLLSGQTADLAGDTTTYALNTYYTLALTYTPGSGAYAFYKCSGGTCSVTASGTATTTFSSGVNGLGGGSTYFEPWVGNIAEWGFYSGTFNSTQLTALGAYSSCKYGI